MPFWKKKDLPYVFVLGFNKTGTTSLHRFFVANGFPAIHWDDGLLALTMIRNCASDRPVFAGYDRKYRVFSDMVVQSRSFHFEANSLFRAMDAGYPGAFFLYNTRDIDGWLASRANFFIKRYQCTMLQLEMQRLETTDPQGVILDWRRQREKYEAEVRNHFGTSSRFMELDIAGADVPARLAEFLGIKLEPSHWGHYKRSRTAEKTA